MPLFLACGMISSFLYILRSQSTEEPFADLALRGTGLPVGAPNTGVRYTVVINARAMIGWCHRYDTLCITTSGLFPIQSESRSRVSCDHDIH